MNIKLSIIIPAYNAEQFIDRCLDSIPVRDDVEVIVIDDGSTDKTSDIIKKYADNFKIIINSYNKGVSFARNTGIKEARGDYITFLDADDEILPGGMWPMLEAIKQDENIVQFNHLRNGSSISRFNARTGTWDLNNLPPKWVLVWNKIYKRSFIINNDIWFPEGQQFEEDRVFNFRCFHYSPKLVTVHEYVVSKHNSENSLCHTVTPDKLLITMQSSLDILKTEDNEQLRNLIWRCLADLINSKVFTRTVGGNTKWLS